MARSGQAGHGNRGAGRGQSLKLAGRVVPGEGTGGEVQMLQGGSLAWGRGVGRGLVTREQDEGAQVGGGSPEHHDLPNGSLARHPRSF